MTTKMMKANTKSKLLAAQLSYRASLESAKQQVLPRMLMWPQRAQ